MSYHTIPYHTILYHTIPYCTIPYHAMSYHTIPYHTIPYCTIPCHTMPCHVIPYHTIPYHTIPYHSILYHTMPYCTIPYHAIPYHTIPCHTLPCHAMSCNVIQNMLFSEKPLMRYGRLVVWHGYNSYMHLLLISKLHYSTKFKSTNLLICSNKLLIICKLHVNKTIVNRVILNIEFWIFIFDSFVFILKVT